MRVFIYMSIFSFMLATCQGKCFLDPLKPLLKNGKEVKPNICIDRYDGKTHPIGSTWRTDNCISCKCSQDGMSCCQRSLEAIIIKICKTGENPESCKDGAPRVDDKCRLVIRIDARDIGILEYLYRFV